MRGIKHLIAVAVALTAVVAVPASAGAADAPACAGADQIPTAATAARARTAIACLIDAARADRGRPALRRSAHLRTAAQRFAAALRADKPLTHTGPHGTSSLDRIEAAGYGRGAEFEAAETLGRGHGRYATPAERVKTWLADAPTRRLLVSAKYRDVGIGVVVRGTVATYVVELARRAA